MLKTSQQRDFLDPSYSETITGLKEKQRVFLINLAFCLDHHYLDLTYLIY